MCPFRNRYTADHDVCDIRLLYVGNDSHTCDTAETGLSIITRAFALTISRGSVVCTRCGQRYRTRDKGRSLLLEFPKMPLLSTDVKSHDPKIL